MAEQESRIEHTNTSEEEAQKRESLAYQRMGMDALLISTGQVDESLTEESPRAIEIGNKIGSYLGKLHDEGNIPDAEWNIIMDYYDAPFGSSLRNMRKFAKAKDLNPERVRKVVRKTRLRINHFLSSDDQNQAH